MLFLAAMSLLLPFRYLLMLRANTRQRAAPCRYADMLLVAAACYDDDASSLFRRHAIVAVAAAVDVFLHCATSLYAMSLHDYFAAAALRHCFTLRQFAAAAISLLMPLFLLFCHDFC